jgi:hypothetical protein
MFADPQLHLLLSGNFAAAIVKGDPFSKSGIICSFHFPEILECIEEYSRRSHNLGST